MGCQTAIGEKIREQQANYVLSVKENQPRFYNGIQDYFALGEESWERSPPSDGWRSGTGKKNHGRIESREALTKENIDWLAGGGKWKDLKRVI